MELLKCDMCYGRILRYPDGTFHCEDCGLQYSEDEVHEMICETTGETAAPFVLGEDNEVLFNMPEEETPDFSHLEWTAAHPRFGAPNAHKLQEIRTANRPLKGLVINCGDYIRTPDGRTIRSGSLRTVPEQFNNPQWRDIVQLTFADQLVGLRADGAVFTFATRDKKDDGHLIQVFGPEENIVHIAVVHQKGAQVICGLRKDGTVITQCDDPMEDQIAPAVARWTNVETLYSAYDKILGLRRDGTVVSTGEDCSYIEDVVAIAVKRYGTHPMFLHSDGTVSFSRNARQDPDFPYGTEKEYAAIKAWRGIADIAYGNDCLIGWKVDGSLVAQVVNAYNDSIAQEQCQEAGKWHDIVAIYSEYNRFVGLRRDGTFAYVPTADRYGQSEVGIDKLFADYRTVRKELYDSAFRKAIREHRKKAALLHQEQSLLTSQLPELNGFFSGSKRKKVQERLLVIEQALKALRREENALFEKE